MRSVVFLFTILAVGCHGSVDGPPDPTDSGGDPIVADANVVVRPDGAIETDAMATIPPDGALPPDAFVVVDAAAPDSAPPDAAFPVACGTGAPCEGDTLCVEGACVNAFGRNYELVVVSARLDAYYPGGDCWDPDCGAPDPSVGLWIGRDPVGDAPFSTLLRNDTYWPFWGQKFLFHVPRESVRVVMKLRDSDYVDFDPREIVCDWDRLTVEDLRNHTMDCQGVIDAWIFPF